jgi:phosphatidate cytidylyltransferase
MMLNIAPGLLLVLLLTVVALLLGTCIRWFALRGVSPELRRPRMQSLRVWWVLFVVLALALLAGKVGVSLLMCVAGLLALREFDHIYQCRSSSSQPLTRTVAAIGVAHYVFLVMLGQQWELGAFPLVAWLSLSAVQLSRGESRDYLRAVGGYASAAILFFWGLSHVVVLTQLPSPANFSERLAITIGSLGWPLFLILLTECDDIAQALIGRRFGKCKIMPQISPGKSWEGFLGGVLITLILALAAAPWMTTLTAGREFWQGIAICSGAAVIISVTGFLGDVNMSALKREAGVKDSGSLLPGMGGMIDRIDSLTFAAPAFYYYALWFTAQQEVF